MKSTLLFILALSFQTAFAQVDFNPVQQIVMKGKTCSELETQAQSIIGWLQSISPADYSMPECLCSSKSCQMDVLPISPYFVRQMTQFENSGYSVSTAHSGPNCFNSALVVAGSLPSVTFTHPYEIDVVLKSSLCRERGADETLQPGDILLVRNQTAQFLDVHAGTYVNDHLAFSKYGESPMMSYSYGLDVDRSYGVTDPECRRVQGTPKEGDHCYQKAYVNFYHCTALYSFVSQITHEAGGLAENVREIYAQSSDFDYSISHWAVGGETLKADDLAQEQASLAVLYEKTAVLENDKTLTNHNREFVALMRAHLFSLYEQTRRIAADNGWEKSVANVLPPP